MINCLWKLTVGGRSGVEAGETLLTSVMFLAKCVFSLPFSFSPSIEKGLFSPNVAHWLWGKRESYESSLSWASVLSDLSLFKIFLIVSKVEFERYWVWSWLEEGGGKGGRWWGGGSKGCVLAGCPSSDYAPGSIPQEDLRKWLLQESASGLMGQPSAFPICLSPPSSGHPALPGNTHTLQYDSGLVAHLPSWACLPAIPEACGSQTTAGGGRRLENMDTRAAPEPQQPRLPSRSLLGSTVKQSPVHQTGASLISHAMAWEEGGQLTAVDSLSLPYLPQIKTFLLLKFFPPPLPVGSLPLIMPNSLPSEWGWGRAAGSQAGLQAA